MGNGKKSVTKGKTPLTRNGFRIIPVTRNDKWCHLRKRKNPEGAPYGYKIIIPNYKEGMKIKPGGFIVRSKVIKGKLMLQIVSGKEGVGREYVISFRKKKLNICNCSR